MDRRHAPAGQVGRPRRPCSQAGTTIVWRIPFALYRKYLKEGEAFVPKYLDLLASGGRATGLDYALLAGRRGEDSVR